MATAGRTLEQALAHAERLRRNDAGPLNEPWPADLIVLATEAVRLRSETQEPRCNDCDVVLGDNWCADCAGKILIENFREQLVAKLRGLNQTYVPVNSVLEIIAS